MPKSTSPTSGDQSPDAKTVPINGPLRTESESDTESEAETKSESGLELDLEAYRVDQDFSVHIQTVKKTLSVPVQRPDRHDWVYLHPDKRWRAAVNLYDDRVNRRVYLVSRHLVPEVSDDLKPKLLIAYTTRRGSWGLWPIRLRGEKGELDSFSESAHAIVMEYAGKWIRILTDMVEKSYYVLECGKVELPAPKWPESFQFLFQLAFKNRVITSLDHPVLRDLRGEV